MSGMQEELKIAVDSGEEKKVLEMFRKSFLNLIKLNIETTVTSSFSKSIYANILRAVEK